MKPYEAACSGLQIANCSQQHRQVNLQSAICNLHKKPRPSAFLALGLGRTGRGILPLATLPGPKPGSDSSSMRRRRQSLPGPRRPFPPFPPVNSAPCESPCDPRPSHLRVASGQSLAWADAVHLRERGSCQTAGPTRQSAHAGRGNVLSCKLPGDHCGRSIKLEQPRPLRRG